MSNTPDPQPGWYPDPAAPTWSLRYWDGSQWTDKTTPRPKEDSPEAGEAAGQPLLAGEEGGPAPTFPDGPAPGSSASSAAWGAMPSTGAGWPQPSWGESSSPAPPPPPRRGPRRAGLVTLVSLLAALVVYFAIPTGPGRDPGTKWFKGGVPGWDNVSLNGWSNSDGKLLQAWLVPGPEFGPDHPFLAVARVSGSLPHGQSAAVVLQAERVALEGTASVSDLHLVDLNDGAPGLLWSNADRLAAAPALPLTDYSLFALKGRYLYGVFFETTTAAFHTERSEVQPVMLNFMATATSAGRPGGEA